MNKKVKVTSLAAIALASLALTGANLNDQVKADITTNAGSSKSVSQPNSAVVANESDTNKLAGSKSAAQPEENKNDTSKSSATNAQPKMSQPVVNTNNDVKQPVNNGDSIDTAYELNFNYDDAIKRSNKIKFIKGLTSDDVRNYFMNHSSMFINGKKTVNRYTENINNTDDEQKNVDEKYGYETDKYSKLSGYAIIVRNKKNQQIYNKKHVLILEPGDTIEIKRNASYLLPNKWYKWIMTGDTIGKNVIEEIEKEMGKKIPVEIVSRVSESNGFLTEKTDLFGNLPRITSNKKINGNLVFYDFGRYMTLPFVQFVISNDTDATVIPHNPYDVGAPADWVQDTPVVPENGDKKGSQKADDAIKNDSDSNKSDWNNAPVDNGTDFSFTPITNVEEPTSVTTSSTATTVNTSSENTDKQNISQKATVANTKNLVYIHNAFVYDKNGKLILSKDGYRLKALHTKAKILDNGKIYTIKGKKYYRVGKNRFVKVANVGRVSKAQKINTRGTIAATKKYGVKLYNANGKYTKKYLTVAKKVKFDAKKFMKGTTFYRIKGTNTWVRSGNIKLVKTAK